MRGENPKPKSERAKAETTSDTALRVCATGVSAGNKAKEKVKDTPKPQSQGFPPPFREGKPDPSPETPRQRPHNGPLSTAARPARCRRCDAVVLDALTEGVPARVDAVALTRDGELDALVRGRRTYVLRRRELILRDTSRLSIPGPVLADHRCGHVIPLHHRAPPDVDHRSTTPIDPPF